MNWLLSSLLSLLLVGSSLTPAAAACSPVHTQMERETVRGIVGDIAAEQAGIINEGDVPMCGCKNIRDEGYTKSGFYRINMNDGAGEFHVFCDMNLRGGGWTVIQRRVDGTITFNRNRKHYNVGFGRMNDSSFWLGLEKIRRITAVSTHELYIGLESFLSGASHLAYARYGSFSLGRDAADYPLHISSYDSASTAPDSLLAHDGEKFSTPDEDNDSSSGHCARDHSSGWWYHNCASSHLNGIYYARGTHPTPVTVFDGILWKGWLGRTRSLKTVVMAIRPV